MTRPLQNRVRPDGAIVADPGRGDVMGNRGGRLHDDARRLGRRRWVSRAWIICLTSFRGRTREVMGPGYTELFFLDEVTALAAGHRPCFECRRAAAKAFLDAAGMARAPELDGRLHAERLGERIEAAPSALPDGAMVEIDGAAYAIRAGRLLAWSFDGYRDAGPLADTPARVLTPATTRAALSAGYAPSWHRSAAPS